MKKIYLLLLLSLLSIKGFSTNWYSIHENSDVTNVLNWSNSGSGPGLSPFPFPGFASDTYHVQTNMYIPDGVTWHVAGTVVFDNYVLTRRGTAPETMQVDHSLIFIGTLFLAGITSVPGAGPFTLGVNGNLYLQRGSFITDSTTSNTTINLMGNLSLTDTSYISSALPAHGYTSIHFNGLAPLTSPETITWTSTGVSKYARLEMDSPNNIELLSSLNLPTTPDINGEVLNGTLICNAFKMTGDGTQKFYINPGANIYMGNAGGIDTTINHCIDTFSTSANYFYEGITPQITGVTFPDSINNSGSVTINNPTGVLLSKTLSIGLSNGLNRPSLYLENGVFSIGNVDSLLNMEKSDVHVDTGTFGSRPTYVFDVGVIYENLGYNALAVTTGNELLPIVSLPDTTIFGGVTVNKPGATITLGSSPSALVNAIFLFAGTLDASASNYDLSVIEWINLDATNAFIPRAANVTFQRPFGFHVPGYIFGGFSTTFNNLTINNPESLVLGVHPGSLYTLSNDVIVNGTLTFDTGNVYLLNHNLFLGASATAVAGTLDSTRMIVADSTGQVIKDYSADGSYLFPIGDSVHYSPITLNFSGSGAYGPAANAAVNLRAKKEPHNSNPTDYLNRYWTVNTSDITSPSYSVTAATYVPGDVTGLETAMAMGEYNGSLPWVKFGLTNAVTHTLTSGVDTNTFSNFTGITSAGPTLTVSNDTTICVGGMDSLRVLTATGDSPVTFTWMPATGLSATTGMAVAANPVDTTTYTVVATDANGFTDTALVTVNVNPAPTLDNATNSGPICSGFTLSLTANNPQNVTGFVWQGPVAVTDSTLANASIPDAFTTATGVYTVTVVNGIGAGCTASYTTAAVVDSFPDSTHVTGGGVFCDSTTIFASIASVTGTDTIYYQDTFSGGTSTLVPDSSMHITALGTHTYYFRAKSALGCWGAEGSVTVTINALPLPDTAFGAGTFCDSTTIGATSGDSGTVYFQGTTRDGISTSLGGSPHTVTASGTYYFRSVSAAGCWGQQDSVAVIINNSPTPVVVAGSGTFCGSDTISATGGAAGAGSAGSTVYYEGNTFNGTDLTNAATSEIVNTSGTYYFRAQSAEGCWSLQDSAVVVVNPLPAIVNITTDGGLTAFCDTTTIFADNGGDGIIYFQGTTSYGTSTATPATSVFINTAGTFYYHFRAQNTVTGCWSDDDSVQITINALPAPVTASGSVGSPFCGSTSISGDNGGDGLIYFEGTAPGGTDISFGSPFTVTASGTYYFRAQSTAGCWSREGVSEDSVTVVVNPLPGVHNVTGGGSYCAGGPGFDIGLDGSDLGINYQLYNGTDTVGSILGGTGSSLDFGIYTAGATYTVIAIDTNTLCADTTTTNALINVNPVPAIFNVTGGGPYCFSGPGSDVQVDGSEFNVNYNVYVNGVIETTELGTGAFPFDLGNFTDTGTYTVIAVTDSGCTSVMTDSVHISTIPLPNLYTVSGGGTLCAGDTGYHVVLSGSDTGISYQLFNAGSAVGVALIGAGLPLDFGLQTTNGVYTVIATNSLTTCANTMTGSATIVVNPLPSFYSITGGGSYCSGDPGLAVGLSGSDLGVNYQLYRGSLAVGPVFTGTGAGFDFPLQTIAGSYSIIATNPATGCIFAEPGSVAITINLLPTTYTIFGGGSYCVGGLGFNIGLTGTQIGINYQLYNGSTAVGLPIAGTGMIDSFGHQTDAGVYTVVATNPTTTCFVNVAGSATITVNTLPVIDTVTGGGAYCAGGLGEHIFLSSSTVGINYQLFKDGVSVGGPMPGTVSALDFGSFLPGGTYKVVAMNVLTGCISNMADSANIMINPLPGVYGISGGGSYCSGGSGVAIGVDNSDAGILYQLYHGTATAGSSIPGTGSPLPFPLQTAAGTYTVKAINAITGCTDSMTGSRTVTVNPLPPVHLLLGGGIYCSGGTGVDVKLSRSDDGYLYLLYNGSGTVGPPRLGTDTVLDFGSQTLAGTYTVIAIDTATTCSDTMAGSATVTVDAPLIPVVSIAAYPGTSIGVGARDTLVATVTGAGSLPATYQWYVNGNIVPGATSDTFAFTIYYNTDSISCQVTSHGICGGYTTTKSVFIDLHNVGVQPITAVGNDIKLVPNPNKGTFTIKGSLGTTEDEEVTVEINDMLGQVIYKGNVLATGGNINERIQLSSSLANGMYILNLRSGSQNNIFHFVIEQ